MITEMSIPEKPVTSSAVPSGPIKSRSNCDYLSRDNHARKMGKSRAVAPLRVELNERSNGAWITGNLGLN
jgi:hypothetical protein